MTDLNHYIERINGIFKKEKNRYTAHELCRPMLLEMARNKNILFDIIKKNISKPDFFEQKRINPVIALDIEINETLSFVAHCWMPLPDKRNDITHQSIHHHGKLLLTSVSAWGTGYESVIFKKGYDINKSSGVTNMQVEKIYKNHLHNIEFIDINTPHIVFYPSEFSITYALWTNVQEAASESIKKLGFIKKYKKQLRKLIDAFGAAKLLGLNTNEYLDFYPENNKIIAMKSRVMYPEGSNASFIKGFFTILQTVQYGDNDSIKNAIMQNAAQNASAKEVFERFNSGEIITDEFEKTHLNILHINFDKQTLLKCLKA